MWLYIARRIVLVIPIAIGVSIVCFALVYLAPGDPIQSMTPADASPADIALIKRAYGFDKPIPIQYLNWLMRALSGDLGVSLQTHQPVFGEVMRALVQHGGDLVRRGSACLQLRLRARHHRGLQYRPPGRPRCHRGLRRRRQRTQLLARHCADHRVCGSARLVAGDRHGIEGLAELRLHLMGAVQIRDPADHHAVAGAARRHHAQHALGGRRRAGAGFRADAARQGARRAPPSCATRCATRCRRSSPSWGCSSATWSAARS